MPPSSNTHDNDGKTNIYTKFCDTFFYIKKTQYYFSDTRFDFSPFEHREYGFPFVLNGVL